MAKLIAFRMPDDLLAAFDAKRGEEGATAAILSAIRAWLRDADEPGTSDRRGRGGRGAKAGALPAQSPEPNRAPSKPERDHAERAEGLARERRPRREKAGEHPASVPKAHGQRLAGFDPLTKEPIYR